MGGHGGLNILHHKSWNVYGKRQRKKVKEDEEKHELEEEQKRKEREKEESSQRLEYMRERSRRGPLGFAIPEPVEADESMISGPEGTQSPNSSEYNRLKVPSHRGNTGIKFLISEEDDVEDSTKQEQRNKSSDISNEELRHVDLFVDDVTKLQKTGKNEKHERIKREEDLKALRRVHPTIFFAEAGHKAANPWYTRRSGEKGQDKGEVLVVGVDAESRKLIEKSSFGKSKKIIRERMETLKEHSKRWNDPLASIESSLGKSRIKYLVIREGHKQDWICVHCKFKNFARNTACYKCKKPKAPLIEDDGSRMGMKKIVLKRKFRDGDWICPDPNCAHHNYKDNKRCFKCGTCPDEKIDVFSQVVPSSKRVKVSQDDIESICNGKQKKKKEKKKKKKASKKKKKKMKKKSRKSSSKYKSSSDSDSEASGSKALSIEELRQQRLKREQEERRKAARLCK